MRKVFASVAVVALGVFSMAPAPVAAQSYPIDCAILLCLSGGWPASVPCTRARAEFIRRITPWPIEPPLQIWRCPMSITYEPGSQSIPAEHIYEAGFETGLSSENAAQSSSLLAAVSAEDFGAFSDEVQLILTQAVGTGADIDLSASVFDFVRSIRVWDVRFYSHRRNGRDSDCEERSSINLGTYDSHGQFRWDRSDPSAMPTWLLPTRECQASSFLRGVGVEWRDYEGTHGHELVRY